MTLLRLLSKARDVFGSDEELVRWLKAPASALDGQRPVDLLFDTPENRKKVEQLIGRIEYGVYT